MSWLLKRGSDVLPEVLRLRIREGSESARASIRGGCPSHHKRTPTVDCARALGGMQGCFGR